MRSRDRDVLFRSTVAATLSIALAMVAVLLIGLWGANRDLSDLRSALLRAEIGRLRSHGIRTVARLESELENQNPVARLTSLEQTAWLQRFWNRVIPRETQRLYAAIVDASGTIVLHSDETLIGQQLSESWRAQTIEGAESENVFPVSSHALSNGQPAFDIVIPIEVSGQVVGSYHSGFDQSWIDRQVRTRGQAVLNRWILIVGALIVVVVLAAVSLHRINRRSAALQQAISMAHVKQLSDLGRLVGALAHEIRNPLNAIRLNLHALRNVLLGRATLGEEEIQQAVEESNREIERLSELMKTMLGYARPGQAAAEEVELNTEVDAIRSFLAPLMDRDQTELIIDSPDWPIIVFIDPDRLRQILLNLLNNAREAAGEGGRVWLTINATDTSAGIIVQDNGPGVPVSDRDRIFEPFYSTRDTGTGLGLALVQRFVQEAGGTVVCDEDSTNENESTGAVFRVTLPRITTATSMSDRSSGVSADSEAV